MLPAEAIACSLSESEKNLNHNTVPRNTEQREENKFISAQSVLTHNKEQEQRPGLGHVHTELTPRRRTARSPLQEEQLFADAAPLPSVSLRPGWVSALGYRVLVSEPARG